MRILLPLLLVSSVGCAAVDAPETPPCSDDRCKSAGSREELLASLDGFADPIAAYLRGAANDDGTLPGDFRAVLDGVGGQLGCDASTERSYIVLSNNGFLPKPIVTRCNGDATGASQFYMALVGDLEHGIGRQTVHLVAWDAAAGMYRRYATSPVPEGEDRMGVNVAPEFCLGCHGGAEKIGTWQPLMNEMSSPWAGWNASPGFASELFDEYLDPAIAAGDTYREVAAEVDSAASFEPIVRAGVQRVTGARMKQRLAAPDVTAALDLVRPLFCDETTNYVSEEHHSGELRTAALVDDAIRSLYRSLDSTGAWSWLADTRTTLPAGDPITLVPTRGESTVQAELALVSRGVIDPMDALRVRALDWKRPVDSDFRCNLWRGARDRIAAGALGDAVVASGATTTSELVPLVFDEVMTVDRHGTRVPLRASTSGALVGVPDAAAFSAEGWTDLEVTVDALGEQLEAYVASFRAPGMRPTLAAERDRRACRAAAREATAPIFPGVACP